MAVRTLGLESRLAVRGGAHCSSSGQGAAPRRVAFHNGSMRLVTGSRGALGHRRASQATAPGSTAKPWTDKTAPGDFSSERFGVRCGDDYLMRIFLLSAVAAFGTWTVRIPS